ncbi:MAG: pyridoxamine 5'-phosphate oxidase family protein [bacterium]
MKSPRPPVAPAAGTRITTIEALEAHYNAPLPRALAKELDHLSPHHRIFIEHAPFVILATSGPEGLDCSPRGDAPGFVRVVNEKTLLLPDRRGNNRLDSLRNLVRDPRLSLLFLVPGAGETLRVNGRAEIVIDEDLRESFSVDGKAPRSIIAVTVERVYYQCQKAIVRSRLWDPGAQVQRGTLPSAGQMLEEAMDGAFDGRAYDAGYADYMKKTLY